MLKNIKLFSTNSDRTTYESSASYETPYVSKVAADNSVHYNKLVLIITFKIGNYQYQAEEGMTWEDWVNSKYNINEWFIYNNQIENSILPNEAGKIYIIKSGEQSSNLIISKEYTYYLTTATTGGGGSCD